MAQLTGGEILVETLDREGISRVFSVPGGQLLTSYDAMQSHPRVKLIVPRHEGASAFMACGWALATGGPAVVMSTVGAGVIYEAGGLLYAWRERLPVLSIAPQVQSWRMKPIQENLQACDQDEIFRPFTKFRAIVYHYQRIPQLIGRALRIATAPEPGPAHLDIPFDVLFEFRRSSPRLLSQLFPPGRSRFEGEVPADPVALNRAASLIGQAARPLVLAGRGVHRARAGVELTRLSRESEIPVITSTAAFSALPTAPASAKAGPRLSLGATPLWEHPRGLELLGRADLLILIEADEDTARLAAQLKRRNPRLQVVQSAALAAAVDSVVPVDVGLAGTVKAVLDGLFQSMSGRPAKRDREWRRDLDSGLAELSGRLLEALGTGPRLQGVVSTLELIGRVMRPDDFLICEGRLPAFAAMARLNQPGLHQVELMPGEGVPGAGLPLALGVKAARPGSRVFLVSETGRFKRHSRELQTGARYGLPVSTFLFQDQERKPAEEVDFARLARSLGAGSRSVIEPEEELTEEVINEGLQGPAGMLFDVSN